MHHYSYKLRVIQNRVEDSSVDLGETVLGALYQVSYFHISY